jgi:hypothetical protein
MVFMTVVLPEPDVPASAMNAPRGTLSETPSTAGALAFPYVLLMESISIRG